MTTTKHATSQKSSLKKPERHLATYYNGIRLIESTVSLQQIPSLSPRQARQGTGWGGHEVLKSLWAYDDRRLEIQIDANKAEVHTASYVRGMSCKSVFL